MNRERVLKIVLVVVGLLFLSGVYFLAVSLWQRNHSEIFAQMMLSIYITLGVFTLLAARNPAANRTLIAFTGWSSLAHAAVMGGQVFLKMIPRTDLAGILFFVVVGIALIALAPARQGTERASAARA
jgi:drug/metabolite transporter superfamily protein YnfA